MKNIMCFPADCHCGSTAGLITPDAWQLDAGGTYRPSRAQRIIWRQWVECWEAVRDLRQPGDRVVITVMGDAVDGKHHDSSELVTQRIEEQERIFIDCLDHAMQIIKFADNDILQFISGTPAHVGELAQSERRIAEDMDSRGLFDRLKIEVNGVKFDLAHDGLSVGTRAWTDDNTLRSVLKSMLFESLLYRQDVPDYMIRAHRHKFINADFARGRYHINGFVCPSFQLKTSYGNRFTANSNKPPDIGMLIVTVDDNGVHDWRCPMIEFPKERYETI
jgi:hypothetical protein